MANLRLGVFPTLVTVGIIASACCGGEAASITSPELAIARVDEAVSLLDDEAYQEALVILDDVIPDLEAQEDTFQLNRARVNRGTALAGLDRLDESVAAFDEVIDSIGLTSAPAAAVLVIEAVSRRLSLEEGAEGWVERYKGYRELLDSYRESAQPEVMVASIGALTNYAANLELLARLDEALSVYDAIVEQHSQLAVTELQAPLANVYTAAAEDLRILGRDEEALVFFQQAIDLAESSGNAELVLLESETRLDMAKLFTKLGAFVEALEAYDAHLNNFGDHPELAHRQFVVRGILESGLLLQDLDRIEEAEGAYLEVLRRVNVPSSDAALASLAGVAQHQLGVIARR